MMEESIYNILPKESIPTKTSIIYKSPFPAIIPPSYSSFNNHPNVVDINNISGSYKVSKGRYAMENGIIGKTKTQQLSPIRHKIMGTNKLEDWIQKGSVSLDHNHSHRQQIKPQVPKSAERPLMNLQTKQNYIETNKIYTILTSFLYQLKIAPRQPKKQTNWLNKQTYGKIPHYLNKIKMSIYQSFIQQQKNDSNQKNQLKLLSESEVHQIKEGLKQKYDLINFEYQKHSHLRTFNISLKKRQEQYERELDQLEKDMEKINKNYIYIIN